MINFKYKKKGFKDWWVFVKCGTSKYCWYRLIGEVQKCGRGIFIPVINGKDGNWFKKRKDVAMNLHLYWTDAQRLFHLSRPEIAELERSVKKVKK